jgi:fumarylacetoacetate (FAA) hydrolase
MKLLSFWPDAEPPEYAGWLDGDWVISAAGAQWWLEAAGTRVLRTTLPDAMEDLIAMPSPYLVEALQVLQQALGAERPEGVAYRLSEVTLGAPLARPRTIRDFYAFEAHVKNARARRGLPMQEEWYQFPVFYFSNPTAVHGPEDEIHRPRETAMLDFELEVAAVISTRCRDVTPEQADQFIAGYMIMNDWSARDIQRQEMKVGLGPAKGKDFATSFGPWLVTPDELEERRRGDRYDLAMVARLNGREVGRGNLKDLHFTFGEMIARASRDCTLYPGEVIGSGTVGTGCLLETEAAPWLEPGDVVELEVERLGLLRNTVR